MMENSPEKENETQFLIHQQHSDGHVNSTTSTLEANEFHGNPHFQERKSLEQNSLYVLKNELEQNVYLFTHY